MSPTRIQIDVIRLCVERCRDMQYLLECLSADYSVDDIEAAIQSFRRTYLLDLLEYINASTTHAQDYARALERADTETERETALICLAEHSL